MHKPLISKSRCNFGADPDGQSSFMDDDTASRSFDRLQDRRGIEWLQCRNVDDFRGDSLIAQAVRDSKHFRNECTPGNERNIPSFSQ